MRQIATIAALITLLATITACGSPAPAATRTPRPTATTAPTRTARPTRTTAPTRTPRPTAVTAPTRTPRPTATPGPSRTPRPTATTAATATPIPPSAARIYAQSVTVALDITTVDDMLAQMPAGMTPKIELTPARYRQWIWTFEDGSQMIFSFKPAGGEGSGAGLRLDHVELKDAGP